MGTDGKRVMVTVTSDWEVVAVGVKVVVMVE